MSTPASSMFGLQAHLDALCADRPRRLTFAAKNPAAFEVWRRALREKLLALLRLDGRTPPAAVEARRLAQVDRGSYVEEKYVIETADGVPIPLYLLVPHVAPPFKPVLVFHGHNPSVQYVLGHYPDDDTARAMRAVDNNYAQALAEAGYLVCAVEQRGFGERVTPQQYGLDFRSSCRHLAFAYLMQGRVLLGERVWDGWHALAFLAGRADIVPGRVGCTGNSGGGTTSLYLAALDDRVSVVVLGSCFSTFKHSILGMWHCECNYVPGILQWAEMGDLAALIAPRPLCFIAGEHDPIYPIGPARAEFARVRQAYAVLEAVERVSLAKHAGGHAYHHAASLAWFGRWL